MSGTRSHRPDLDDASAQSDLIYAPQPITIDQTQAAQIGGSRVQVATSPVAQRDSDSEPDEVPDRRLGAADGWDRGRRRVAQII
jgi:hypothetical protein